jgi:hypothetical protein
MVAVLAKEFGQLPSVVARDLDEDPLRLSISCAHILSYAEAHHAFSRAKDDKALEAWKGSKVMAQVRVNAGKLGGERRDRIRAARAAAVPKRRAKR